MYGGCESPVRGELLSYVLTADVGWDAREEHGWTSLGISDTDGVDVR